MLRAAVLIASLLAADVTVAAAQTSTRIRGTIESATEQALTYRHETGEVKVVVPPHAPIVTLGPGDKSPLVVGAGVFVPTARAADASKWGASACART
jgi:hypothetical protein